MSENKIKDFMYVFTLMKNVKKISFKANSLEKSDMGWNYIGKGDVVVTEEYNKLYFFEKIVLDDGTKYTDKKLWNFRENCIEFCRFRNGIYEKIFEFLFHNGEFLMKEEYLCTPDFYYGKINIFCDRIYLVVEIKGEKKDEVLEYTYLI